VGGQLQEIPARRWRSRLFMMLRMAVAVTLIGWLASRMNWSELGSTLAGLNPLYAIAGLGVLWLGLLVAVVRWQRVLTALGSPLRYSQTGRIFGAGLFLNLFLPTSIGGDVYRLARVQGDGFGTRRATLSLAVERGIGLVALLCIVAPAVILHPGTRDLVLIGSLLGGGVIALVVGLRVWGGPIADALANRFPVLAPMLGVDMRRAIVAQAPMAFFLSLLIHLSTVTANYLFARGLDVNLSFPDAMALVPLVVLAGQIPISPGGLGVREAGFVYFFGRVGIPQEQALAVGLTWLAALYLTGAVGGLLFLGDRRARPAAEPEGDEFEPDTVPREAPGRG
jgi:uncharacterized membrane protein YbhN (UPF0104 family)